MQYDMYSVSVTTKIDLRIIAYGGRSLSKTERKYHTTEKECLAIIHAIKNNNTYLSHNRFAILTDHRALCWLNNTKHKSERLLRWALPLQPFLFDVKHINGKENGMVLNLQMYYKFRSKILKSLKYIYFTITTLTR